MKKLSFVIIDDAAFMRMILKKMIEEQEGYTVIGEGANGKEAIELAEKLKPDIMTMDITMPVMTGIEAIKPVLAASPHTKIIMLSAIGQRDAIIEAIQNGAKDFVVKPLEKSRVFQAIRNSTA